MHYKHLTLLKRDIIAMELAQETPKKDIALLLNVHISTIYREIKRNAHTTNSNSSNYRYEYYASHAQNLYISRLNHSNASKFTDEVKSIIQNGFKEQLSFDAICGVRRKSDKSFPCSRTLYNYIKSGKVTPPNNYRLKLKKWKQASRIQSRGKSIKTLSIDVRPHYINSKKHFGHWELDLIESAGTGGYIIGLRERQTRFTLTKYIPNKYYKNVNKQVRLWMKQYSIYSITTDNGSEFNRLYELKSPTNNLEIYYAHPGCPYEKGSIEEFNKLLREFIYKKSVFTHTTTRKIAYYTNKINNRPMKILNYKSPYDFINMMLKI